MHASALPDLPYGEPLTRQIIGLAIEVHRHFGPGLLEVVYEACLCEAMARDGLAFMRQAPLPVTFHGTRVDCGFRADIVVEGVVIVEVKAVERIIPLHQAQLLTYLRVSGCRVGLLMNFNCITLKSGLRRVVV